jgi:hypothetical protein
MIAQRDDKDSRSGEEGGVFVKKLVNGLPSGEGKVVGFLIRWP